jgi:hypothetical protein
MKNWKSKRYSGQAIAIIMVLLVVATIIGFSVYSRMQINRELQVDTKESTRAESQADTLLEVFTTSNISLVQNGILDNLISQSCFDTEEGCEYIGYDAVIELFNTFGLEYSEIIGKIDDWCSGEEGTTLEETSQLSVTVSYAGADDAKDYSVGEVFAMNTKGLQGSLTGCAVTLRFASGESFNEAFTTKKVYMDQAKGEVSPYELNHMELYCIDNACDNILAPTSSAEPMTNNQLTFDMAELNSGDSNPLYEVRILPLNGTIAVAVVSASPECGNNFRNFKIVSDVTCGGNTIVKQVIIPSPNNSGYSPLFDYTIYNATGTLQPE